MLKDYQYKDSQHYDTVWLLIEQYNLMFFVFIVVRITVIKINVAIQFFLDTLSPNIKMVCFKNATAYFAERGFR
jgi:hypothetical protein